MKTKLSAGFAALGALLVSACAIPGFTSIPGENYGDTPPRLVVRDDKIKAWENWESFGPVPGGMLLAGEKLCSPLNARPIGYHPLAEDENGRVLPGGGYFCQRN